MADLRSSGIVVLVVEDDGMIRTSSVVTLEDEGYTVLEAPDADEAVRILERRMDVRLLFTDIDMPGSMDGLKLAASVRGRWPPIEIIVTSGYRRVDTGDLPERTVFMPKPYSAKQLLSTVHNFLH